MAGGVGVIKVESITRVVFSVDEKYLVGSRSLVHPAKWRYVSRGTLYLPYCTYYYIHINSAYETTEKG